MVTDKQIDNLRHFEDLIRAFGGSTADWEWTGEMFEQNPSDLGAQRCACGHSGLRWLFPWKHPDRPGQQVITGSTCVEQVPGLSQVSITGIQAKVDEAIKRQQAEKRAAAAKIRRAAQDEATEALRLDAVALFEQGGYQRLMDLKREGRWIGDFERYLDGVQIKHDIRCAAKMKTPKGQQDRYRSVIQWMQRLNAKAA